MKKIILVITAMASMVYDSYAQDTHLFTFGFKAGANFSNVYDAQGDQFNADPKFGLATGAFISVPIWKNLGVQHEILFSQRGFHATGNALGNSYDVSRTSNYLDLPLFVTIKPVEFITLLAGPQFSYLLKQKDVFSNTSNGNQQIQEFNNNNVRKNTLCFVTGADFDIEHFVLGARAGWDLTNNNGDGTSTTPRYKNVWLQATLGYRFY